MPDKEGLETIRELHQICPAVKIIAISGGCPSDGRMDFLPLAKYFGASTAIYKPFLPEELSKEIDSLLKG
jgi:DNA-binding response OmpR family regulator